MGLFFAISPRHLSRKFKVFFAEFFLALLYTSGYNIGWYGLKYYLTGPMSGQKPRGLVRLLRLVIEDKKILLEVYYEKNEDHLHPWPVYR